MVKTIFNLVKKHLKGEADLSARSKAQAFSAIGPLSSMLGPSGRITLASLKWFFQESGRAEFIEFVQNPMLIGSALNAGYLFASDQPEEEAGGNINSFKINKTQIVNLDDQISKRSGPGSSLPYAIYPLMKRTDAESPGNSFTIGRTKNKDMNMKDMAISKTHAIIRISRGAFFIEDCGSTNGTRLNGQNVKDKPQKLHDKDIIALGSYKFTFLFPSSLHDLLSKS
jgi:hypothetical protein